MFWPLWGKYIGLACEQLHTDSLKKKSEQDNERMLLLRKRQMHDQIIHI